MAQILAGIKSKFILSINDHPDIREIFQAFNIHLNIFCFEVLSKRGINKKSTPLDK